MVDLYTGTVPNLTQSQPEFDTNTQSILDYIGNLAPQLNEWVGAYVQDTSSTSITSNSIGAGSKTFAVEAGKGYKVNMPVRASATTGNYMDGVVTAYSGTSLTVNFASSNGTGTFTSWNIFLIIPGSNVTLGSNTFTGDQIVPDESYDATGWNGNLSTPTKNAIRDKIEAIIIAVANATNDPTFASTSGSNAASPEWTNGRISAISIGIGQSWQDVKSTRAVATTYTNTTGKPILVIPTLTINTASSIQVTIAGLTFRGSAFGSAGGQVSTSFIVPNGVSYSVTTNAGSPSIDTWIELRS
jgi:hypothetical protein